MNYWKVLRWTGALLFVAVVLLAWVLSDRHGKEAVDDDDARVAPTIVR